MTKKLWNIFCRITAVSYTHLTAFALLIPAFSLLYTPQPLTLLFLRVYNLSLIHIYDR